MKAISFFSKSLLALLLVAAVSCNKDDDFIPADLSEFFRLKSFEVAVEPESRTVKVLFQVTDYYDKGAAALDKNDFIVTENNGNIDSEADLRVGRSSIPFSLRTVLLLDITRSVEGLVPQIKSAAKSLIQQKLPEQEIAIYTFDAGTVEVQSFSKEKEALLNAVDGIPETGLVNSTNLYGAVIDVADLWEDNYSIDGIVDGSLIIFTDGRHNATPAIKLSDALDALGNRRAYVAALNSPDLDEGALQSLAKISDRYFKADDIAGLGQMFLDIQNEIQSLSSSIYFLYYQSPISDPRPYENDLKIEVKNNANIGGDSRIIETFNSEGFGG
ncbi:MAG TPA: VWA domain-containing protein [Bacteroidetes bacterium]|nr:VWA domain-containing protein [Bacteroidota bacterium]